MKTENTKEFKAVENLEIGKDYISESGYCITINRKGNTSNTGFRYNNFADNIICEIPDFWREATPEEVKERFEVYLVKKYGEDWETMKIKERHPSIVFGSPINNGSWEVMMLKSPGGWNVWNKNGLLYCDGIWVERLEEEEIKKSSGWTTHPKGFEYRKIKAIEELPIDKVTTKNLDIALRMVGIQLDVNIIDKVIDLVELIENKGDDVTIKDIVSLQQTWSRHSKARH